MTSMCCATVPLKTIVRWLRVAGKVTADQIDIDFILDERARELISEENRRMTLVRTNTLAERIN